jgi:hypothetical protein
MMFNSIAEVFNTPNLDALSEQRQQFVRYYVERYNGQDAARRSGYAPKRWFAQVSSLLKKEDVQGAISELENIKRHQLEQSKNNVMLTLMARSTATPEDISKVIEYHHNGQPFTKRVAKEPDEVDPFYLPALCLGSITDRGEYRFDTTAANSASKILANYMKWDRESADKGAPVYINMQLPTPGDDNMIQPINSASMAANKKGTDGGDKTPESH